MTLYVMSFHTWARVCLYSGKKKFLEVELLRHAFVILIDIAKFLFERVVPIHIPCTPTFLPIELL